MKHKTQYQITLMLLLVACLSYQVKAAISTSISKKDSVSLEGMVDDPMIASHPTGTEVHVVISKYPFNRLTMQRVENKHYVLKVKNNENFKLMIPMPAMRSYMHLSYTRPLLGDFWSSFDNVYILEKGDELKCKLSNDIYIFSGKGADKLNCQTEIYKLNFIPKNRTKNKNAEDHVNYVKETNAVRDSVTKLRLLIVERYRSKLGDELSGILTANCYGMKYFTLLMGYPRTLSSPGLKKAYGEFLTTDYYKQMNIHDDHGLSPSILVQAPIFTDYLLLAIKMKTQKLLPNGKLEKGPQVLEKIYAYIIKNYDGLLRDKLIATFFASYKMNSTIFNYMEESLKLVKNEPHIDLLVNFKKTRSPDVAFFPFALQNTEGKVVKLEDLKDKVVIIDFWYTGCIGCAKFKSSMSGVWEVYKDHPKVAFVTISIDKDKELWKKSILSKKYTEPEAINLYTNGEGKNHPIIRDLYISSYPTPYILKSGKIYSSNPPRPEDPDITKEGPAKQLVELIEKAIEESDEI